MMGRRYRARRMTPVAEPGPGSAPDHSTAAEQPPVLTTPSGARTGGRAIVTLSGVRHPIIAILLLISFFTTISGKPLDGMLMLLVAAGLARDGEADSGQDASEAGAGQAGGRPAAPSLADAGPVLADAGPVLADAGSVLADAGLAAPVLADAGLADAGPAAPVLADPRLADAGPAALFRPAGALAGRATTVRRGPAIVAAWLACGVLYAVVVGSFSRYSWPATVAVIGLGAAVVLVGWQGPVRDRPVPGPLPRRGRAWWGGLLVAGGSWELAALLQQPNLAVDSYAHPTISSLTDPLLGSYPGRSLALAVWLGLGWLVIRR